MYLTLLYRVECHCGFTLLLLFPWDTRTRQSSFDYYLQYTFEEVPNINPVGTNPHIPSYMRTLFPSEMSPDFHNFIYINTILR